MTLTLIEVPAGAGRTRDADRIVFASTLFDGDVARAVVDAVLTTYYDLRHEALANRNRPKPAMISNPAPK